MRTVSSSTTISIPPWRLGIVLCPSIAMPRGEKGTETHRGGDCQRGRTADVVELLAQENPRRRIPAGKDNKAVQMAHRDNRGLHDSICVKQIQLRPEENTDFKAQQGAGGSEVQGDDDNKRTDEDKPREQRAADAAELQRQRATYS